MKKILLTILLTLTSILLVGCSNEIKWDEDSLHYDYDYITTSAFDKETTYEDSIITFSLFEQKNYQIEVIKYTEISLKDATKLFDLDRTYEHFKVKLDINKLLTKYAIGTGVILTLAIVDCYMPGAGIPTKFLMAIAGANSGAVTGATAGLILGGAIGFIVEFIKSEGDWEAGMVGALEHAIDGFMFGAIFGALEGASTAMQEFDGYKIRNASFAGQEKHISPDSEAFKNWAKRAPGGRDFYKEYPDGITIRYDSQGFPDFTPFAIKIPGTTNPVMLDPYTAANVQKGTAMTTSRRSNFELADKLFSPSGTMDGMSMEIWRSKNGYTWHEHQDLRTMILVPTEINGMFGHTGGVGLIRLLTGG